MDRSTPDTGAAQDPSLRRLLDVDAISRVKYAYLRCLDQKDWDGLAAQLTDDATAAYSGGRYTYTGRDEIVAFLQRNMGREAFHSSHRVHHPEIDVEGNDATATWALEDTVLDSELDILIFGAAFYEDRFRCDDGAGERRWRIAHTGYRRTFEAIVPTSELPGLRLTASWWATDGRSTLPVN